jgi:serine phosphatase RsbU (regulator of sigma subunit)
MSHLFLFSFDFSMIIANINGRQIFWLNRIIEYFIPDPIRANIDHYRRARLGVSISLGIGISVPLIFVPFTWIFIHSLFIVTMMLLVGIIDIYAAFHFRKTGKLMWLAHAMGIGGLSATLGAAIVSGVNATFYLVPLIISPLVTMMVGGPKIGIIWMYIVSGVLAVFVSIVMLGMEFPDSGLPQYYVPLMFASVLSWTIIGTSLIARLFETLRIKSYYALQEMNTAYLTANQELSKAHEETKMLLTNVNDSIRYAKRIQDAMLPSTETLNRLLPEHFIFFRPKDVVSGDFYWCKEVQGKVFVAAVDCTGHGVPGAFMSLIGNSLLNDITQRLPDTHPDLILNDLHHELQRVLRQRETNNDDGMDICLCMIDLDTRIIEFAGAMNPLYAVVQGELREWKGTSEELGGREERSPVYERHILDLSDVPAGATMLYLSSDGYKDQYNAERQRFMPKRLRPLLLEIAGKPLEEQPRLLGAAIDAHRGDTPQVDDMLVLGVRL